MKIDNELPTWNLQAMYKSDDDWNRDFDSLPKLAQACEAFKGHLIDSPQAICNAMKAADDFSIIAEKLYTFANLKSDADTRIAEDKSRLGKIAAALAELSPAFAWFEPELTQIPDDIIQKYLKDPVLDFYKRSILESLKAKKHTLTEPEERLLGTFSEVIDASGNIFEALNDTDLTFGKLKNSQGEMMTLTHGTYRLFMEDPKREVRQAAFKKLYKTYEAFRNSFAQILNTTVKAHVVSAKTRNFDSSLEAALFPDNIPTSVYTQLIQSVHDKLPYLQHYMKVRQTALKLPKQDMWDIYTPLFPECKCTFSWPEAVKLAQEALKPMGKEYCQNFNRAFSERWIDVPERKGKRSGAYSSGCYDSFPYILLNFQGSLDDVFTLVHEAGHSLHSLYSRQNQQFHYADYKIFVAEVASTTNEILLAEHLLSTTKEKQLKAYLLSHLADEIRLTIYRQTMFAEFELLMHNLVEQQQTLTADLLDSEYFKLNNLYHGFKANKLISLEWARIPHFHYNFYVYKYATGMSAAIKLANDILHQGQPALDRYINFLKAGSSQDVLDIMRNAGVNLEEPTPVQNALDYFENTVTQLEKLL